MILCCRLAAVALAVATSPAVAQAPARVRGVITAVDNGSITIKQRSGRSLTLRTGPYTIYSKVVPATLDEIRAGDFVGTASKGPRGRWVAVEVVIIPETMRAGRAGYAGWDPLPDPAAGVPAANKIATSMTNGLVSPATPPAVRYAATTMTNGTVASAGNGTAGRTLTITLVGGKPERIFIPAGAPITRFVRSDRSAAALGAVVFVKTNPGNKAGLIAAGQGITPPM
jgi:hypothetical protein